MNGVLRVAATLAALLRCGGEHSNCISNYERSLVPDASPSGLPMPSAPAPRAAHSSYSASALAKAGSPTGPTGPLTGITSAPSRDRVGHCGAARGSAGALPAHHNRKLYCRRVTFTAL